MYYIDMVSGAKQGKLAELLYSVIAERNISIQALASVVGVQRQTCYAWLHEYQQPKLDTLRRLAIVLNIPLAELIAASYADVEGTRLDSLLQVYLDLPEDKRRVLEDIATVLYMDSRYKADLNNKQP